MVWYNPFTWFVSRHSNSEHAQISPTSHIQMDSSRDAVYCSYYACNGVILDKTVTYDAANNCFYHSNGCFGDAIADSQITLESVNTKDVTREQALEIVRTGNSSNSSPRLEMILQPENF